MRAIRSSLTITLAALVMALGSSCKGKQSGGPPPEPPPEMAEPEAEDPAPETQPAGEEAEPQAEPQAEATTAPPPATRAPARPSQERLAAVDEPWHGHYESELAEGRHVRDYYVLLLAGARKYQDSDFWSKVDSPFTLGANLLATGPKRAFHWDIAISYGRDDTDVDVGGGTMENLKVDTWEIDAGIAKILRVGMFYPYFGAGVSYLRTAGGVVDPVQGLVDESDSTIGGYGRAGLMIEVTRWGGLIGVDARYVAGTSVNFGGFESDVDGFVGSLTFGFSW